MHACSSVWKTVLSVSKWPVIVRAVSLDVNSANTLTELGPSGSLLFLTMRPTAGVAATRSLQQGVVWQCGLVKQGVQSLLVDAGFRKLHLSLEKMNANCFYTANTVVHLQGSGVMIDSILCFIVSKAFIVSLACVVSSLNALFISGPEALSLAAKKTQRNCPAQYYDTPVLRHFNKRGKSGLFPLGIF